MSETTEEKKAPIRITDYDPQRDGMGDNALLWQIRYRAEEDQRNPKIPDVWRKHFERQERMLGPAAEGADPRLGLQTPEQIEKKRLLLERMDEQHEEENQTNQKRTRNT